MCVKQAVEGVVTRAYAPSIPSYHSYSADMVSAVFSAGYVRPVLWNSAKSLGREALRTGGRS